MESIWVITTVLVPWPAMGERDFTCKCWEFCGIKWRDNRGYPMMYIHVGMGYNRGNNREEGDVEPPI